MERRGERGSPLYFYIPTSGYMFGLISDVFCIVIFFDWSDEVTVGAFTLTPPLSDAAIVSLNLSSYLVRLFNLSISP